jgi:hypothetical protein
MWMDIFSGYPSGCPTESGRLVFMQRRLLNFFEAVWEWNFQIITKAAGVWTEKSMLIHHGLPTNEICLIEVNVACSFQMKCATGFFAAHRTVSPRKAALNIVREAQALVSDVRIEFAEHLRGQGNECSPRS